MLRTLSPRFGNVTVSDGRIAEQLLSVSDKGAGKIEGDALNELIQILLRLSRLMESQQVVDQQQRQKICLDAITGALTLANVTTVGTVTNAVPVGNVATIALMDREMYINQARWTYNTGVRANLNWA